MPTCYLLAHVRYQHVTFVINTARLGSFLSSAGIDLNSRQSPLMEGFAIVTMAIYLGMVHLLIMLMVASLFSRTALYVMIGRDQCGGIWGCNRAGPVCTQCSMLS